MGAIFCSLIILLCSIYGSLQLDYNRMIVFPDAPTCDTTADGMTKTCFQNYMNNFNIPTPYVFGNNTLPGSYNKAVMDILMAQGVSGWVQICGWQNMLSGCLDKANVSYDACLTQNSYKNWFGCTDDDSVIFRTNYYLQNYQCGPANRTVINNYDCLMTDGMRDQDAINDCYNMINESAVFQTTDQFCQAFDNTTRCLERIITRDCGMDTRGYMCMIEEIGLMVNTNMCTGRLRDCAEDDSPQCPTQWYNNTKQCFKAFYDHFGLQTPYVYGNNTVQGSYLYARNQMYASGGLSALNNTCDWQYELNECLRRNDVNLDHCADAGSWTDWFLATLSDSGNFRTDYYIRNFECGPGRSAVQMNFNCLYNSTLKDLPDIANCYNNLNNANNSAICYEFDRTIECLERIYDRECGPTVHGFICNTEEIAFSVNSAQCAGRLPDCTKFECLADKYNTAKQCFDTFYKSFGLTPPYVFGNDTTTPNTYNKAVNDLLMSQGQAGWNTLCSYQQTLTNCLTTNNIDFDRCITPMSMFEWFSSSSIDSMSFRTNYYLQNYQCGPANRVVQNNFNCLMNASMKDTQEAQACYAQLNMARNESQFCDAFNNGTRCLERIFTRDCGWDTRGYMCSIENLALSVNSDVCTGRLRDCSEDSTVECMTTHYSAAKNCFQQFYAKFGLTQQPFVFGNGSVPGSYVYLREQLFNQQGVAALDTTCGWQSDLNTCLDAINMSIDICLQVGSWQDWFLSTGDDSQNFRTNYFIENYNCGPAREVVRSNFNCIRNGTIQNLANITNCYQYIYNTSNEADFCRGYNTTIDCLERAYDQACGIGVRGYICSVEELGLQVNTAVCGGKLPDCTAFSVPRFWSCPGDMYNTAKQCFQSYYNNFNISQPYRFGNNTTPDTFVYAMSNMYTNQGTQGFDNNCQWQNTLTSCLNNAFVYYDQCIQPISWFEWFGTTFDDAYNFRDIFYTTTYECGPAYNLTKSNFACLHNNTLKDMQDIQNCYNNIPNNSTGAQFCSAFDGAITCLEGIYTRECGSQVSGFICNVQELSLSVDTSICQGRLQDCTAMSVVNVPPSTTPKATNPLAYFTSFIITLIVSMHFF